MRDSQAAVDAVRRFYNCFGSANREECFDRVVSGDRRSTIFGTDPDEYLADREQWRKYAFQPGVLVKEGNPRGFADGTMGWVIDQPRFIWEDESSVQTRLTAVVVNEDEEWKVMHVHISLGVPNKEVGLPPEYTPADS